ncbi:unnamed protein product [Spirodela intermedia]|uniref:Uncharacterized protein n=1 Tax=Spirodela intermedia TaxID=51605 RepID=A0A7I8IV29_SPIIN|nr:unnamed protein product [Spirodela intermedia]CAA6660842.1 unnamed protein product [Spirodela intermedia]
MDRRPQGLVTRVLDGINREELEPLPAHHRRRSASLVSPLPLQLLLFDAPSLLQVPPPFQVAGGVLRWPLPASYSNFPAWNNVLVFADFGFLVARWSLDLFSVTATVFAASAAHREERPFLRDLHRRIRREWRGPVVTQLCVVILRTGYRGLAELFADALLPVAAGATGLLLAALGALLGLASGFLYYFLDVAWESSLAAAAVDSCAGFRALGLAGEMTEGRRLRGMILVLINQAMTDAASMFADPAAGLIAPGAARLSLELFFGNVVELLRLLRLVAFTVLYCDYRRRSRPEEGDDRGQYSRLTGSPPR